MRALQRVFQQENMNPRTSRLLLRRRSWCALLIALPCLWPVAQVAAQPQPAPSAGQPARGEMSPEQAQQRIDALQEEQARLLRAMELDRQIRLRESPAVAGGGSEEHRRLEEREREIERRIEAERNRKPTLYLITSDRPEGAAGQWMDGVAARIECMGTRHYPSELAGKSARIVATLHIAADGKLEGTEIGRSSGSAGIDANVERIARLAAPFGPLPAALREKYGTVSLTTTFNFGRGNTPESKGC